MASPEQLVRSFALLQATFPRDLTPLMTEVYEKALADVSDAQLEFATGQAIRRLKFFPMPSELRDFAGANAPQQPFAVDLDRLLDAIHALGEYNPHGWIFPRVESVQRRFGLAIANAYAVAGTSKLFNGDETGRSIARREFRDELSGAPPEELREWVVGAQECIAPPAHKLLSPPLPQLRESNSPDWTELKAKQAIAAVANSHAMNEK